MTTVEPGLSAPEQDACCSMSAGPVDAPTAERMSARLKALADPMRLRLLSHIAAQGCDSVCACDLLEVVEVTPRAQVEYAPDHPMFAGGNLGACNPGA